MRKGDVDNFKFSAKSDRFEPKNAAETVFVTITVIVVGGNELCEPRFVLRSQLWLSDSMKEDKNEDE